jgi:hypothetical protein
MAKKTTTRKKTAAKKATPSKKTPATSPASPASRRAAKTTGPNAKALKDATAAIDANLKAIAAADQANATKRDQRAASADGMAPSERAMAETASKGRPAKEKPAARPKADRKPSGLDLAAKILADAGEPLNAKQIAERAIAAGWQTSGKTPQATLYAAMLREIAKKGDAARFRKADRGLFEAGPGAKPKTKKGA